MQDISNQDFLQAVFGQIPDDESIGVCLFDTSPDAQTFWPIHDTRRDVVQAALTEQSNAFYCISTVARQNTLRRRQASLMATYVIPLDDIGIGPGAKAAPVAVPLEPTYSVETSPGNFQYGYVLTEPLTDIHESTALIRRIAQTADEGAAIPNKLIRLPQGINSKSKYGTPPPQTRLTVWEPERTYTVTQLLDAWSIDADEFYREVEARQARSLRKHAVQLIPGEVDDDVLAWLENQNMVLSDDANAAGFFEIECPWHDSHTTGNVGAGYSPVGYGEGEYRGRRQFSCLHDHCASRKDGDLMMWMYHRRFVWGSADGTVYDKLNPSWRSKSVEHFKHNFAGHQYFVIDPANPKGKLKLMHAPGEWLKSPARVSVARETFYPDPKQMLVRRNLLNGDMEFNTYVDRPRTYTDATDRLGPIFAHIEYLFGKERDNALGFMAHTVHNQTERASFALLHVAQYQGTGRGWFKQLMELLVGPEYFKNASFTNYAQGGYTEFLYRSLLVSFDEVYDRHLRFNIQDRMRELITEKHQEINVKYGFKGEADIFANVMMFSNHIDALKIDKYDRRFWYVLHEDAPKSAAYYAQLYKLLQDEEAMNQMWSFLKREMVSTTLNIHGRAPITEERAQLIEASETEGFEKPVREIIEHLRENDVKAIFRSQLISDCRLNGAELPEPLNPKSHSSAHFEHILRSEGLRRKPTRINLPNGKKETVYLMSKIENNAGWNVLKECQRAVEFAQPTNNITLLKGPTND